MGMKLGEIRKLDIPWAEGYGIQPRTDLGVPARSNLRMEVELLRIRRGGQGTGRGHWAVPHAEEEDHIWHVKRFGGGSADQEKGEL